MNYGYEKNNKWLICSDYQEKECNYEDKEYLKISTGKLYHYRKFSPVPFIATYDPKKKGIYISVGKKSNFFKLDNEIHPNDYVSMIRNWMDDFYISFDTKKIIQVSLAEEIIARRIKEGEDFDTLIEEKVDKEIFMFYKIVKTTIYADEFIVQVVSGVDRHREVRITHYPISIFLTDLRKLEQNLKNLDKYEKGAKLFNFIDENSRVVSVLKDRKNPCYVEYSTKKQIDYFFEIHQDLVRKSFADEEQDFVKLNFFNIYFTEEGLKDYFINKYLEIKNK